MKNFIIPRNQISVLNYIIFICACTIGMLFPFKTITGQGSLTSRMTTVHKTSSKIIADGILNEEVWKQAAIADSFINKWPTDVGKARLQTGVSIYTMTSFYILRLQPTWLINRR